MRLLLSNDDGVHAPGLAALAAAFPNDEVWIVAPDREQSASSHSISLHRPLRIVEVGPRRFSVDGTPTDAVYMALNLLLRERRPDLVISGVNHGPNLGNDVLYSGTVAAAMEGAILGCHAIAVSLASIPPHAFEHAAAFAAALGRHIVRSPPPAPVLLNVNVPPGPVKGYRFARLGHRTYGNEVIENRDPRGRKYYWIGGEGAVNEDIPHSDCNCVFQDGLVSVTPLHLDWSHDALLSQMKSWTIEGFAKEPSL
ncbi:MAG: 5'/3'-nucleotidase SurE [Anaeromyxobacter sp. RBG_16_69_14]|nr:MAG: 5'/3'-nucleotidase SurE [Anaeromyxobacter sp. RBG_16_69_14]